MNESDLYSSYEKLIAINIMGRPFQVPEKNYLLRCFQFLSTKGISYAELCWNGECSRCQFWYHFEGETIADDHTALSCRFTVKENMVITRLSPSLGLELDNA